MITPSKKGIVQFNAKIWCCNELIFGPNDIQYVGTSSVNKQNVDSTIFYHSLELNIQKNASTVDFLPSWMKSFTEKTSN